MISRRGNLITALLLTFPAPGLCLWIDDGTQTGGIHTYRIKLVP